MSSTLDINSNEPLGLLSLSNNDISLISKYCTIEDISRLDVAYCNQSKRDEYLGIISDKSCVAYDHIKFDLHFKHVDNALIWIGNRKINISALSVGFGEHCRTVYLSNDGLVGLSKHCSLLSLQIPVCTNVTDAGIIAIIRTCVLLKSLDLSWCENITDAGIFEIAIQCKQLESLDISWCKNITDARNR